MEFLRKRVARINNTEGNFMNQWLFVDNMWFMIRHFFDESTRYVWRHQFIYITHKVLISVKEKRVKKNERLMFDRCLERVLKDGVSRFENFIGHLRIDNFNWKNIVRSSLILDFRFLAKNIFNYSKFSFFLVLDSVSWSYWLENNRNFLSTSSNGIPDSKHYPLQSASISVSSSQFLKFLDYKKNKGIKYSKYWSNWQLDWEKCFCDVTSISSVPTRKLPKCYGKTMK